jgi:murein L,D-transpeptidase YcbB/YkuD
MARTFGAWIVLLLVMAAPQRAPADTPELLQAHLERLAGGADLRVGEDDVAAGTVLPLMYERAGYRTLWNDPGVVDQLLVAVDSAYEDGLDPNDYHLPSLVRRREALEAGGALDAATRAEWDLLLSDALVRLELHLRFGKVDPASVDPSWDFLGERSSIARQDEAMRMVDAIEARAVSGLLEAARPQSDAYRAMRAELARLRAIAAGGPWPVLPDGPTLRPGGSDIRVVLLRSRLAATGDLVTDEPSVEPAYYDEALVEAVRSFQRRHNLAADGAVGARTRAALAAPPESWINQLRVNMERARWIRSRFANGVMVDIAAFDARYVRSGEVLWQGRVTVGTPYRSTPVLSATIRTLVLNPTWTVPPTILEQDILPEARKDPEYIDRRGIRVYDREGNPVDARAIDWNAFPGGSIPFTLRQGPGESNPLGRIKFLFPNPHFVYLHDTPSRGQFARADRAASSGCIRIERPLELATLLVDGMPGWSRARIDELIATGATKVISLDRPVPVYLLYSTVSLAGDGELHFSNDIYGRDPAVLVALDRAYRDGALARPSRHLP